MKNRGIYQRDPGQIKLLNNGVATMTEALTTEERRTLRFELEHFVCEGQYREGLVRILDSYVASQGQPEQRAAWISGFFGSGKSHLAKMLRFLWTDYAFPEDGASARGLARLPNDVLDLLKEISTLGRRGAGLHAAAGTLGAGAGDSVRLALLGIVLRSAGLPAGFPQARFCIWLKKNNIHDQVKAEVEAQDRDFLRELNDLYVSPRIAQALLSVDSDFAAGEKEARAALRAQFPKPKDITDDEFVEVMEDALAQKGGIPCTVVILDEVQQYIGDNTDRSYAVQEVVESCSKRFGDRLLFVATGQTALSGETPALQRLQGRFAVNVELSDQDVETVTRRVVLAKRADQVSHLKSMLEANAGEIDRHLTGAKIAPRTEDRLILVEDYPLLPVRRRFWEHTLRAVDKGGMAGQLRTQLRIVYEAIRHTADKPVGSVVPADFLFDQISQDLLQTGVLLREIHETIVRQRTSDGGTDGELKSRLCALVFLIRKLPRETGFDIGVRATADTLADLLVEDLAQDGTTLRARLPILLEELAESGALMNLGDEYSLQTQESSDWQAEFRNRRSRINNDLAGMSNRRAQQLGAAVQDAIGSVRLLHGAAKDPRKLLLHFGIDPPPDSGNDVALWVRDGWGARRTTVMADARTAGSDSPIIHAFVPKSHADALARLIADQSAAAETLDYKGVPSTPEGAEARQGMETRRNEAAGNLRALVAEIVAGARVIQGGGSERHEANLQDKVRAAADASLARLFPDFRDADDNRWPQVIKRARAGAEHPLEALSFSGKTEEHPVCSAVLTFMGSGKKGKDARSHFSAPPFGWPRDAIDAALISLFEAGHLRATLNGVVLKRGELDQAKTPRADFRAETVTISTRQRLKLRKLFQAAGINCKPNEESVAAADFLNKLEELGQAASGDAPLPPRPDMRHLSDLQGLAGNEQLNEILNQHHVLTANFKEWTLAGKRASERLPAFKRLQQLARHADGLDADKDVKPQIEAIVRDRRILDETDPLPPLAAKLTDALRSALAQSQANYDAAYDERRKSLENADSWRKIKPKARDEILASVRIEKASAGATGDEREILESLNRISLDDWRTRTAALSQQFADAQAAADRLIEPKIPPRQAGQYNPPHPGGGQIMDREDGTGVA